MSNTTIARPKHLKSENKAEGGGLSGRPLTKLATATIRDMYRLTKGKASRAVRRARVCGVRSMRSAVGSASPACVRVHARVPVTIRYFFFFFFFFCLARGSMLAAEKFGFQTYTSTSGLTKARGNGCFVFIIYSCVFAYTGLV